MLRRIREEEPPKPSTRLSTTEELPTISANRHTEPARLAKLMRGELDWIVMKCLEKDRTRRYETANGLAARPAAPPRPRAGGGRAAVGLVPAAEVRAAQPGGAGDGGGGGDRRWWRARR